MPKPKNGPGGHGGAPRGGFQKPKNMGKTVSKLFLISESQRACWCLS